MQDNGYLSYLLGHIKSMTKKDLADVLGYKSRVSEIFSKKRKLNINMIRKLHDKMNIPYESLIANY